MRFTNLERSFTRKGFMSEGHSINRPPFFDGIGYSYWKNKMEVFIRAQDYEIWKVVNNSPYILPKDENEWTSEHIMKSKLNFSVMNIM